MYRPAESKENSLVITARPFLKRQTSETPVFTCVVTSFSCAETGVRKQAVSRMPTSNNTTQLHFLMTTPPWFENRVYTVLYPIAGGAPVTSL
jgi:hypothetical protein